MARAYIGVGRFEDSERLSLDVIDVRRRVSGEDNLLTILSLCYLGMGYVAQNRHAEAERVLSDALERSRRGESILITNLAANALAGSYRSQGRLADAERLYRTTLQGLGSNRGATYDWNLVKRAELVALQGRRAEAEQLYHEALALRRRTLGEDHSSTIATLRALMRLLESDTDTYRARERIEPLLADLRRHAEKPGASADLKNVCAWELLTCKPAALHDPQRALELALSAAAATGRQDPDVLNTLALAYHEVGRSDEAVRTAREARALLPAGPSFLRSAIEANLAEYEKASAGSIRGQRDE
jgi:tetratricopeptide (TPR) repeat protein